MYPDAAVVQTQEILAQRISRSRLDLVTRVDTFIGHLIPNRRRNVPGRIEALGSDVKAAQRRGPIGASHGCRPGRRQFAVAKHEQHPLRDVNHDAIGDCGRRHVSIVDHDLRARLRIAAVEQHYLVGLAEARRNRTRRIVILDQYWKRSPEISWRTGTVAGALGAGLRGARGY